MEHGVSTTVSTKESLPPMIDDILAQRSIQLAAIAAPILAQLMSHITVPAEVEAADALFPLVTKAIDLSVLLVGTAGHVIGVEEATDSE